MARRRTFGQLLKKGSKWAIRFPDPAAPRIPGARPRNIVRTIGSKKDAQAALKDIHEAIVRGTFSVPTRDDATGGALTFAGAVARHAESCAAQGVAEHTAEIYRAAAARVAASPVGSVPVVALRVEHVERFLKWRRAPETGKPPAPGTISLDLNILSAALEKLVARGDIGANPAKGVRRPKSPPSPRQPLNAVEVERLLSAASDRTRPLILAALLTGARFSELAGLRWGDVDAVAATVAIRRRKNTTAALLPLHPTLAAALARLRSLRAREGGIPGADDSIFITPQGTPMKEPGKGWEGALRRAGLADRRGITFHSLRHTFACNYLSGGGNIRDLQHAMGHADISVTEVYLHASDARLREGVLRLGAGARMDVAGAAEMRSSSDPLPLPDSSTESPPSQLLTGTWDASGVTRPAPAVGQGVLARPRGVP